MATKTPKIIAEAKRKQKLFTKTRDAIKKDFLGIRDSETRRIIQMLNDVRAEVLTQIASSDFRAFQIPQLIGAIDQKIDTFRATALRQIDGAQDAIWEKGKSLIDDPFLRTQVSLAMPELSTAILESTKSLTVDLINNLTRSAKDNIKTAINMGIAGGKSPIEVMRDVGQNLTDPSVFGSIAKRAEAIVRTEYGSVFGKAGQTRLEQAQEAFINADGESLLKKEWRWSGVSRKEHAAIDGQIRDVDEPFTIPLPGGSGTVEGMFPRDPGLPVSVRVNCSCQSLPFMAEWDTIAEKELSGGAISVN